MRLSDFVEDSSPLSSRADGKGSRGEGPHWEWGSLFGRDEESKFLQSLVQRKQQQPFLHQKNKRQPFKKSNSSASSSSHAKEGNARSESFLQYPGSIVLMHGAAGSGKSSLVKSQQWNEQYGWLFASGKFLANQKKFQEPFSALIEACNELIDFWMKHNDFADINQLKNLLDEEVELLRYVLPRVYQVVSKACAAADSTLKLNSETTNDAIPFSGQEEKPLQPPDRVAARNSSRARKRNSSFTTMKQDVGTIDFVNASFIRILSFLCQVQPVVLFMDDVQWADAASAKVLKNLATRTACQVDNLLLILAYREEEMPTNSCMQETLHAIQETAQKHQPHNNDLPVQESQVLKRRIYDMPITNLTVDSVNALIASLTKRTVDETMPLAKVVHKKTAGNPFFVTQFIQMLRSDHFLRYSYTTDQWEWGDVERLHCAAHLSDNVADIVAANIERLPYSTRVALQVAACLGKIIPQNVLVQWFDKYYEEASAWVGGAADSQMLHQVRLTEMQSILDHAVHNVGILIRPKGQDAYMWAHDKLQAVAYSLIPSSYRPTLHLSLGRLLWQMSQEEYLHEEWMVFIAANQMNRYSLLQQQHNLESEKDGATEALGAEVADLCHEAAWLSLAKSALYPAYEMLKASIMHLNVPDKWANHYDLCLSLYSTVAELSAQLGRYEETMEAVEQVKAHARSFDHKFRVQIVHLKLITGGQDRNFQLGWETSVEYLKERGVRMPKKLLPGMLASEFNKLRRRLPGGKIDGLIGLPDLTDRHSRNTIKMLVMNGFYSLLAQTKNSKRLTEFAALRALSIAVDKKAVSHETAMAVTFVGLAYGAQGQFKEAGECGGLALKLLDRFPQTVGSIHAEVMMAATSCIFSYTKPFNKCLDLWLEAHSIGLRTGNTEKAGTAIIAYGFTYFSCGLPLSSLQLDLHDFENEALQFNLPSTILASFKIFEQFFLNLQEPPSSDPTMLKGQAMDQDEMLASFQGNAHRMTKRDIDTFRLVLAIIYGKLDAAELLIGPLEQFSDHDQLYVRSSMRRLFMALAGFKLCRTCGKRRFRPMACKVSKEFRDSLKRGNVNALPFYIMLYAEESPSKDKYENAIRSCARLGLIHYEAYMCEQAGLYFLEEEQKDEEWAEFYLAQAVTLYSDWGAVGKVQQLRLDHSRLLRSQLVRERAKSALKGRTRYDPLHADLLKDFDYERIQTSTIKALSLSSISSSSSSMPAGYLSNHKNSNESMDYGNDKSIALSREDACELLDNSTSNSSCHDMGDFTFSGMLS